MPNYGAIDQGEPVFYERKDDGPEKLVGRPPFNKRWQVTPDGWKASRTFSYDHSPAGK